MTIAIEVLMVPDRHEMNPDIFPMGGEAVQSVFEKLKINELMLSDFVGSGKASIDNVFFSENPHVSNYLLNLNRTIDDASFSAKHLVGHSLFYAAMKEKVDQAILPQVSKKFVDKYGADRRRIIPGVFIDPETGDPDAIADLFRGVALFKIIEPDVYNAVADSVNRMHDSHVDFAGDYLMAGFAQAYFLYRAAFSSPANYDQNFLKA